MKFSLASSIALLLALSYVLIACSHEEFPTRNISSPATSPQSGLPPVTSLRTSFSGEEGQGWTLEQIPQLADSQIQLASADQIRSLTPQQVQAFTPLQITHLRDIHIQALGSQGSNASLKNFTQEQLTALGNSLTGLRNLTPLEQFHALSPEQFELIPKDKRILLPSLIQKLYEHRVTKQLSNRRWTPDEVKKVKIEELGISLARVLKRKGATEDEIHAAYSVHRNPLSEVEMRELFLSASLFTIEQMSAIDPGYIKFFWSLPVLSAEQIQALLLDQIAALSSAQLNLLSPTQVQALTSDQMQIINLKSTQVRGLSASFTQALFPEKTLDRVRSMGGHEIAALGGLGGKLGNLELKAVIVHCGSLNRDQLRAFRPEQMEFFGQSDLASLTLLQIPDFLSEQISALHADSLLGFTPQHLSQLNLEQARALTNEQLESLRHQPASKQALLALPQGHLTEEQRQVLR